MTVADPHDEIEREFFARGVKYVIGCDEVGRGAVAGPVTVGMALMSQDCGPHPVGLRDSKMLSEKRRVALDPEIRSWAHHHSVGFADACEVDEVGIIAALGRAGSRALEALVESGVDLDHAVVLLDGAHNWLAPAISRTVEVHLRVKADRDCVSVAAASVIAKVHRDSMMIASDAVIPGYGWSGNKGYGSGEHLDAIARLGLTDLHRRSWLVSSA